MGSGDIHTLEKKRGEGGGLAPVRLMRETDLFISDLEEAVLVVGRKHHHGEGVRLKMNYLSFRGKGQGKKKTLSRGKRGKK